MREKLGFSVACGKNVRFPKWEKRYMLKSLIVLLLLCLGAAGGTEKTAPPPVRDLRIAVVDLSRLFQEYKRAREFRDELITLLRSYSNKLKSLRRRVAQNRNELKDYAIGTAEFLAKQEELRERVNELRALEQEAAAARNSKWVILLKDTYADIDAAVQEYARERKIDLVIKQQSIGEYEEATLKKMTRDSMAIEISQRTILFATDQLDITDAILERLNETYDRLAAEEKKEAKTEAKSLEDVKP